MIGDQIKKFRIKQGMTQKNLADKLFVTAQAVSRWENGEVEPSIGTITEMSKIFNVTTDEILGISVTVPDPEPQVIVQKETEYVYKDPPTPVLAVCEKCNSPIYKGEDIVRHSSRHSVHIICKNCEREAEKKRLQATLNKAAHRKKLSYILGGLSFVAVLAIMIVAGAFNTPSLIAVGILTPISAFTLVSCLLFSNNFIENMILGIAGHHRAHRLR